MMTRKWRQLHVPIKLEKIELTRANSLPNSVHNAFTIINGNKSILNSYPGVSPCVFFQVMYRLPSGLKTALKR